jgi:hypothetical protein
MNSRALFWPAHAVDVMSNESDMSGQSRIADGLPIKNANNLKINYANIIDKLRNPLNQSISHNHKPGENLMASVNFQPTRQVNRQGTKLQSV